MNKVKYYYNTHTLKYEKVEVSISRKAYRVIGFFAAVAVFSAIVISIAYSYLDSPKEKRLKREIAQLELQYDILQNRMQQMEVVLTDLQDRDNNIYRVVFEAEPIPLEIRQAGFGGVNRYKHLENFDYSGIMVSTTKKLEQLSRQLYVQSKSYDFLVNSVKNKHKLLASVPAIQPVANKKLKRMASGYGMRIHPIYKTAKMHYGMDFTAPRGTEIYATGDGTIEKAETDRGYGSHVVIEHGYGYESLYGHMSKILVKRGQKVKRGQVIGLVGNSGVSTAPHVHYEVHKNGKPVNPVHFYFNDLSAPEYQQMLQISSQANQSFD
ncbi:MAG TPA: M23 family metallopeptidase [Anseongella sp.]